MAAGQRLGRQQRRGATTASGIGLAALTRSACARAAMAADTWAATSVPGLVGLMMFTGRSLMGDCSGLPQKLFSLPGSPT